MRPWLAAAVLAASPVVAQDAPEWPTFDATRIDACLEGAQTANPDAPDHAACIGAASGPCIDSPDGDSTVAMSWCLSEELAVWDRKLNDSYAHVLAGAKATDAEMAEMGSAAAQQEPLLRQMQRDWMAFRDSACSYEGSRWGGGTGAGPAGVECSLRLTAQQYLRLRAWEPQQ
ncbi:lysozyme inhibitor LprI family protein [uncultured Paracoccus sp.]|uniref:lysozyme inhibitor LprI family protein n=1 Tax=uncultured Paracoccus sp. TaxID=189685 RepID=UPI0025DE1E3F|nr:lysozyme inhibitor LprI family protein [uncultured Paracoccus sp.]